MATLTRMPGFCFVLSVAVALCACADEERMLAATTEAVDPAPVRILALGDSYTVGEDVPERDSWPSQLVRALAAAGVETAEKRLIARTGWTTTDLIDTLAATEDLDPPWSIVTLLIGVNNQFGGMSSEAYGVEFDRLLACAIGLAGDEPLSVVVISLPDYGATPVGALFGAETIAREIDEYNSVNFALAQQAGTRYVDVTAISRLAADERGLVASDGLHPSGRMYALWVEVILPAALDAISYVDSTQRKEEMP